MPRSSRGGWGSRASRGARTFDRRRGGHRADRRARAARRRRHHDRRRHGRVIVGSVPLVPPAIDENFGTILEWADGLRRLRVRANADTPEDAAKAREFGARGHRPLPHRAHVHGRGAAAGRARDDPRARRGGAARRTRAPAADAAGRLRGDLRGDGRPPGHDPPPRPAAARVPAAARGGDLGRDARPHPPAARGEPDAGHARLSARPAVPRDLRDAGAGDRARRARRPRPHGRGAARRDHAPARRLHRGARTPPRADRARRGGGAEPSSTCAGR